MQPTPEEIVNAIEEKLSVIAGANHKVFRYLPWQDTSFRRALLVPLASKGLLHYLKGPGDYRFADHYRMFERSLKEIAINNHLRLSDKITTRFCKGLLVACVNVAFHKLFPEIAEASYISLESFQMQFTQPVRSMEFQGMDEADWSQALEFRNLLSVALDHLVPSESNQLMLKESCALLCGINKCIQGSNPGKVVKRLYRIFDALATKQKPSTPPSEIVPCVAPSITLSEQTVGPLSAKEMLGWLQQLLDQREAAQLEEFQFTLNISCLQERVPCPMSKEGGRENEQTEDLAFLVNAMEAAEASLEADRGEGEEEEEEALELLAEDDDDDNDALSVISSSSSLTGKRSLGEGEGEGPWDSGKRARGRGRERGEEERERELDFTTRYQGLLTEVARMDVRAFGAAVLSNPAFEPK